MPQIRRRPRSDPSPFNPSPSSSLLAGLPSILDLSVCCPCAPMLCRSIPLAGRPSSFLCIPFFYFPGECPARALDPSHASVLPANPSVFVLVFVFWCRERAIGTGPGAVCTSPENDRLLAPAFWLGNCRKRPLSRLFIAGFLLSSDSRRCPRPTVSLFLPVPSNLPFPPLASSRLLN